MRIIFLGSGDFGVPTLQRLHERHEVVAVVSRPDRPAGRKRTPTATPVASWAQAIGIGVWKDPDVNDAAFVTRTSHLAADAAVVVAFGQKLGPALLESLGRLSMNLHASLLPKYRGAAPINWAMIRGEAQTGLSVISLASRMDAGDVYAQSRAEIDPASTAGQLHDRLAQMGPDLVEKVLADFQAGTLRGRPQDESQITLAPKLSKSDGCVDFGAPAREVRCRIHGLTPWPAARVIWKRQADGSGHPLTILRVREDDTTDHGSMPGTVLEGHRVAVAGGTIRLLDVQVPGKKAMKIEEFAHGQRLAPGDRLIGDRHEGAGSGTKAHRHEGTKGGSSQASA